MPHETMSFLQRLQEYGLLGYGWILLISFWAGTVRYLTSLKGRKPTICGWLTETCVSGFVGILTAMTCQHYGMDFLITSAVTGICAHNGTRSLYLVSELIKKNTSIDTAPAAQRKAPERLAKREEKKNDNESN